MQVATAEPTAFWTEFFRGLIARGLTGVFLVTSDAHRGFQAAVGDCLAQASWQRCRSHFAKNLSSQVPKTQWPTLSAMFHTSFHQPDADSVWAQAREVVEFCGQKCPHVADYLEESLDELLAFTTAPKPVWTKRSGPITPPNGSTEKSDVAPTSSGSSQTVRPSSGWSGPSLRNNTMSGSSKRYMSLTSLTQTKEIIDANLVDDTPTDSKEIAA